MKTDKKIVYPFSSAEVGKVEIIKIINKSIERHFSDKLEG